jgi:hypothetical protein
VRRFSGDQQETLKNIKMSTENKLANKEKKPENCL